MQNYILALSAVSVLALTGCVSQEQADAKMEKGCQAAISAMIAPRTVKEFKSGENSNVTSLSGNFRRINLTYVENDDFAETQRQGSCMFSQQWGMMKSSHTAMLEQVKYNDQILGKVDGNVQGSMDDFLKLIEKVDTSMGSQ